MNPHNNKTNGESDPIYSQNSNHMSIMTEDGWLQSYQESPSRSRIVTAPDSEKPRRIRAFLELILGINNPRYSHLESIMEDTCSISISYENDKLIVTLCGMICNTLDKIPIGDMSSTPVSLGKRIVNITGWTYSTYSTDVEVEIFPISFNRNN